MSIKEKKLLIVEEGKNIYVKPRFSIEEILLEEGIAQTSGGTGGQDTTVTPGDPGYDWD